MPNAVYLTLLCLLLAGCATAPVSDVPPPIEYGPDATRTNGLFLDLKPKALP